MPPSRGHDDALAIVAIVIDRIDVGAFGIRNLRAYVTFEQALQQRATLTQQRNSN
jgi:hypothetical protein